MKKFKKIIDISLSIYPGMITYSGNPQVKIKKVVGKGSQLSKIQLGSHTGTHVDSPRHICGSCKSLDQLPLEKFVGPCRVLNLTRVKKEITIEDLKKHRIKKGDKILAKTKNSQRGFKKFRDDFIYLNGDAADYLAKKKISIFGIDYLSVKQKGSNDSRAHTSLLKSGVVVFEGLNLAKVVTGDYYFVGLPLKIVDADGAPARVILLK